MTPTMQHYGEALFGLAWDAGTGEETLQELEELCRVFEEQPDYVRLLDDPALEKAERTGLLDTCLRGKVQPSTLNFLKILCEKGMVSILPGCTEAYRNCWYEKKGITVAKVWSAVALSDQQQQALCAALTQRTGKQVLLQTILDPDCMAGLRVEVEGKLLDGTLRTRLSDLRATLNAAARVGTTVSKEV